MKGRSAALAVAALLGGTVLSAAPATAKGTPGVDSISWGACSDPSLQAVHAQCGFVSVPLDYNDPSGRKIQLAVSRIKHTSDASHYQGVLISNPGGPGGSGLNLNTFLIPVLQAEGFKAAVADYDWIGFDPRGVGSSKPAISCIPNYFGPDRPSYIPTTPQLLNHWLGQSQAYAQACDAQGSLQSALLRNMTTRTVARDLDSIRQALGQQQITYYGYSYGTDIGQVYATMFPTHVRRIILDSNVDLLRNGYHDFNLDQDGPFNRNVDIWLGWIARYNSVYHLGTTEAVVKSAFYNAEAQLAAHPAGGVVGPDEWTDLFLLPGYFSSTWVQWAQAFSDWVNKHDTAAANELISLYQAVDAPGNDNGFAVYLSVLCTDAHWPLNWSTWNQDVSAIYSHAPFEAWGNAWFNAPCIFWTAPSDTLFTVNGSGIKNMLLIDETLDAATPFEGSLDTRQLFPNSVLLAEPGGTNHAFSLSGDLCVDSTVAAYLTNGTLPARDNAAQWDKTCAPLPEPVPTVSSSSASVFSTAVARQLRPGWA
jgi:pimeloyl-ACP methyl ester carboxylesterase